MTTKTGEVMDQPISDPVTKAVVDNIMGNLPTKKPHVRCEDCNLSFTSQTVLDAHLGGARHAKQIKSKTILNTLEETNVAFSKDQETSGLRCNVCNVSLNSIQQLQTHLNGNRHKKKATKGNKLYLPRHSRAYAFRYRRIIQQDKLFEKNAVFLIQCLILCNIACFTFLLTFAFHRYKV